MRTHLLGFPRIGAQREIKKACEQYWSGRIGLPELLEAGRKQRQDNIRLQLEAGIDLVPCNDFSFYDHVLDMSMTLGAIPERYRSLRDRLEETDLYFAMARGYQRDGLDVIAMEMTKWFDTNYHYLVPEFTAKQDFQLRPDNVINAFREARQHTASVKPVLVGPISYLLLGKEKENGFHRLELLERILPLYAELLRQLQREGAEWVQLDEPFLVTDPDAKSQEAYKTAYTRLKGAAPGLKLLVATYFEGLQDNTALACSLGADALHIDLTRAPEQLQDLLRQLPENTILSAGLVDGRNIWKNDYSRSLSAVSLALEQLKSPDLLWIAPSCSLLHVPYDLELETGPGSLPEDIKKWVSFARQKAQEVVTLARLADASTHAGYAGELKDNILSMEQRRNSPLVRNEEIRERLAALTEKTPAREHPYAFRRKAQADHLQLPLFPTTTIGSFPQTAEVRQLRSRLLKGTLPEKEYQAQIKEMTCEVIRKQEEAGLDVLVHGEFERNDMVQYFGERLEGFAFTKNGWVQSYGSRGVKPPLIFGDVSRPNPMTTEMARFAGQQTGKPVKGMLTGPVTMLQWSFVRDDQPRELTAFQIAAAIRDEVTDLEQNGISVIQIDEPAIREGLPLRKAEWPAYLDWAVKAFRIASTAVKDSTQVHTHMCYSEFNDIIEAIGRMDADVITIETSRSQMELLDAFAHFRYPNEIGPGVYDIHSPRIPSVEEIEKLLEKALEVIPPERLWVNPDCGLKTRDWPETEAALVNMVRAARNLRQRYASSISRM